MMAYAWKSNKLLLLIAYPFRALFLTILIW